MCKPEVIRVLLVDDNRYFHEAVSTILNMADDVLLVGLGNNGEEGLQLCGALKPDLILMDVVMVGMSGVEATSLIHRQYPDVKILALSSVQDDESVREMLRKGAVGYILKGSLVNDLVSTIRTVYSGKVVFSTEITRALLQTPDEEASLEFGLTPRELGVLKLMANGLSHKEIAAKLIISQSTVKFHIVHILKKMAVETRSEAIVLAAKRKLI